LLADFDTGLALALKKRCVSGQRGGLFQISRRSGGRQRPSFDSTSTGQAGGHVVEANADQVSILSNLVLCHWR